MVPVWKLRTSACKQHTAHSTPTRYDISMLLTAAQADTRQAFIHECQWSFPPAVSSNHDTRT